MQEENSEASPLSVEAKNLYIIDWLGGTLPFFFCFLPPPPPESSREVVNFSAENLFLGIRKGCHHYIVPGLMSTAYTDTSAL